MLKEELEVHQNMLSLPEGYTALLAWHRQEGATSYELYRVYGPDGRLDEERSYWVVTPLDQGDQIRCRHVTYGEYRSARGEAALPFAEFSAYSVPAARIEEWTRLRWISPAPAPPSVQLELQQPAL
jgi:hypothetical protein